MSDVKEILNEMMIGKPHTTKWDRMEEAEATLYSLLESKMPEKPKPNFDGKNSIGMLAEESYVNGYRRCLDDVTAVFKQLFNRKEQ